MTGKKAPNSFDAQLGRAVDNALSARGASRDDLWKYMGWNLTSLSRKLRGETPFLISELRIICTYLGSLRPDVPVTETQIVNDALDLYGGFDKLLSDAKAEFAVASQRAQARADKRRKAVSEVAPTVVDEIPYIGRVDPLKNAADTDPRKGD